mgnify:CR=1 FL=1
MIHIHLSKLLGERKMKMTELSEKTGINKNTIGELYYEKSQMVRFDTLDKICKALDCSISELLEYVPEESTINQE